MKKILIIAYYYSPMNNGGVQRIVNFKKYLPQYGYEVGVVTTDSMGYDAEESNVFRFRDKEFEATHIKRTPTAFFLRVLRGILVRMALLGDGYTQWKKEVLAKIDSIPDIETYDYVLASYPPESDLEIGFAVSEKYGIPLIVDYRDGLCYQPFDEVIINKRKNNQRKLQLEEKASKNAAFQIVVNQELYNYYEKYNTKTVVIENGFDDEETFPESNFEFPKGFNIVYTGAMELSRPAYETEDINKIIQSNPGVNFIFIGRYSNKEKAILQKNTNVYMYDQMNRKAVIPIQQNADMLLLITGEIPAGMTGKIFEYLFARRPILNLGGDNIGRRIICETDSGESYHPEELDAIHKYIEKVRSGNKRFEFRDLEQYTRRAQSKRLAMELDRLKKDRSYK